MMTALFIVWRESIEAMLVIGILHAWLRHQPEGGRGLRYLWSGVGAGVGLAALLALAMLGVQSLLSEEALEYFQIGMVLVAAALITQMVLWMQRHGRGLRQELEAGAARAAARASGLGVAALAAIAVGREGAETVIFLYGSLFEHQGGDLVGFWAGAATGFALALGTFWLIGQGARRFSWRRFFLISEVILLLLASALLVGGIERLIGLGLLPALVDPLWDSSALLDDSGSIGSLAAAFAGYRSQPALLTVLAYVGYWALVAALRRPPRATTAAAPASEG